MRVREERRRTSRRDGTKIVSPTTDGSLWVAHPVDPDLGYNNEVWLFSLRASE